MYLRNNVAERETPRLGQGGVAAPIKQYREASLAGADGAVVQQSLTERVSRAPVGSPDSCQTRSGFHSLLRVVWTSTVVVQTATR